MNRIHLILALSLVAQVSSARTEQKQHLQPAPADKTSIASQLMRYKGQTLFLNAGGGRGGIVPKMAGAAGARGGESNAMADAAPQRMQQESDVFKVGKPGSKTLYLLNDYRGLQVVSFAAGVTAPKLVGRVAASGNYPDQMYYDASRDRLVVLERLYYDQTGNYNWSASQSRAVVYDVSNPEAPKVAEELAIDGEIADSRLVGDVLYVATSIRPDYNDRGAENRAKGVVYSIQLAQAGLKLVQRQELALAASARENMNIVEIEKNGSYSYYLLAVLSETGWGWWDRQSQVEVVDISSPKGVIKPVMVVSARGEIRERSQTTIKDDTLIVVSNFREDDANRSALKIAVETFKLPSAASEIIDETEAQYRKLHIDRELKGLTGQLRAQKYAQLVADAKIGVLDRFVRVAKSATTRGETAETSLRKVVADSLIVSQNDEPGTDGQPANANIQDVRFVDGKLYVFWVPQDNRDPFDLFDISQPREGVRYLKRLKFEGWIQRAIPVRYKNREFVLALGHVIPAIDDGQNRRYPQAMLFEIVGKPGSERQVELAQLTLKRGDLWTDFNGQDKEVEVSFTGEGQGSLMFQVYARQASGYVGGGKTVRFDLNAALQGDFNQVFTEGSLLVAEASWLKRVFTNPEIARINSFSNEALATFDIGDKGAADSVGQAVNVLELARNLQAYLDLPAAGRQYGVGVQIIRRYTGEQDNTILRLVDASRADADKTEVLSEIRLEGGYEAHGLDASGAILVSTQEHKNVGGPGRYEYKSIHRLYRVKATESRLELASAAQELASDAGNPRGYYYSHAAAQFVRLKSGETIYRSGSSLFLLSGEKAVKVAVSGCEAKDRQIDGIVILGGTVYATSFETVADPTRKDIQYTRHYLAPMTLSTGAAQCGAAINVPGKPIALSANGHLVTDDERFVDYRVRTYRSTDDKGNPVVSKHEFVESERALESLQVAGGKATLVDDYELGDGAASRFQAIGPGRYGYFQSEERQRGYSPYYRGGGRYYASEPSKFVSIGFNADLSFNRQVFVMPDEFVSGASFAGVFRDPTAPTHVYGVVTAGRQLQIVRWTDKAARPELLKLSRVNAAFGKEAATETVVLPQGYYNWRGTELNASFNPRLKSLQIPQGETGVVQVYLAE